MRKLSGILIRDRASRQAADQQLVVMGEDLLLILQAVQIMNRPQETAAPTPTPDPRYRNDYDWSRLAVSGDVFSYDDEQYTSSWGIDVSFHQGTIDWSRAAKSGIQFAMIRVGYRGYESGILNEDSQFRANMNDHVAKPVDPAVLRTALERALKKA